MVLHDSTGWNCVYPGCGFMLSKHLCKINFTEDFEEYMKKKKNLDHEEAQVCSVFQIVSKLVQSRAPPTSTPKLFILQFIACSHSNMEPELIMLLPSWNVGTLGL